MPPKILTLLLSTLLALPATTSAHFANGEGLASSLAHSLFALDHLLVLLGIAAAIIITLLTKSKTIWKIPAISVTLIVVGGLIFIYGPY